MNPIKIITKNDMTPFTIPTGGVVIIFSYLDPPLGAGVQPTAGASNRIIARNRQFLRSTGQGNNGLKLLYTHFPVCYGTTPQNVYTFSIIFFTIHAYSCSMYVPPYYYFRPSADFLYIFTCGYDTAADPTAVSHTLLLQHNLPGYFLPKIQTMNHFIYNAINKDKTFKCKLAQRHIFGQNYGKCYEALYHLIAPNYPINSPSSAAMVQSPPSRLPTQTLT